jgi:hypothetical protein
MTVASSGSCRLPELDVIVQVDPGSWIGVASRAVITSYSGDSLPPPAVRSAEWYPSTPHAIEVTPERALTCSTYKNKHVHRRNYQGRVHPDVSIGRL